MIGALITLAVGAMLCSILATLGNHAIAHEFRDFDLAKNTEILMDPAIAVRYAEYRLAHEHLLSPGAGVVDFPWRAGCLHAPCGSSAP